MKRLSIAAGLVLALAAVLATTAVGAPASHGGKHFGPVKVTLLAINDFHGHLEPPSGSSGLVTWQAGQPGVPAGGAEFLATHVKMHAAVSKNPIVVAAGDLIGASPLISALFHDEPAIEAMNAIGLDLAAVGNHEFDEGATELLRMQNGGCHPVDGCADGDGFEGADFQYLSANVVKANGRTLFPAFRIRRFEGEKVAFIGMTLEGTPTIVSPSGVQGLQFRDEADTVNALVPRLRRQGAEAIVVLLHEGGFPTGLYNECPGISGPIVDIVERMSDEVDAVISGHTHQAYNCVIDGTPVTSASSFGRVLTKMRLTLNRRTGDVTRVKVNNFIVDRTVEKDAALTTLVTKYKGLSAPLENRVIGQITADITRTQNAAGESQLGDVIADSQLAATSSATTGNAVIALMNPGGIRADLSFAASGSEGDGNVTYGEAFTVQPFGNSLVTLTLTGAQIERVLEQQFDNPAAGQNRILQVSNGFTYTWNAAGPAGDRIDPATIKLNGTTIDATASFRVTVNSFLADGGDNFTALREGTDRLGGDVDLDALEKYFVAQGQVAPGPQNRITRVG